MHSLSLFLSFLILFLPFYLFSSFSFPHSLSFLFIPVLKRNHDVRWRDFGTERVKGKKREKNRQESEHNTKHFSNYLLLSFSFPQVFFEYFRNREESFLREKVLLQKHFQNNFVVDKKKMYGSEASQRERRRKKRKRGRVVTG